MNIFILLATVIVLRAQNITVLLLKHFELLGTFCVHTQMDDLLTVTSNNQSVSG